MVTPQPKDEVGFAFGRKECLGLELTSNGVDKISWRIKIYIIYAEWRTKMTKMVSLDVEQGKKIAGSLGSNIECVGICPAGFRIRDRVMNLEVIGRNGEKIQARLFKLRGNPPRGFDN